MESYPTTLLKKKTSRDIIKEFSKIKKQNNKEMRKFVNAHVTPKVLELKALLASVKEKNEFLNPKEEQPLIEHKFEEQMTHEKFFELIRYYLFNYKHDWDDSNIQSFYTDFQKDKNLIFCDTSLSPLISAKMDILIGILVNKKKYDNSLTPMFSVWTYSSFYPITFEYKTQIVKFSKNELINIIKSKAISDCYLKCLSLTGTETTRDILIEELEKFIKRVNIYYIKTFNKTNGFTIYNGDIFINKKYVEQIKKKSNFLIHGFCAIIITLLHELLHCANRILRTKKDNYIVTDPVNEDDITINSETNSKEQNTIQQVETQKKIFNDIGDIFDFLLLGSPNQLCQAESLWLVTNNFQNFDMNYWKVKEELIQIRNKSIQENKKERCFTLKNVEDDLFELGECSFSKSRNITIDLY